MGRTLAAVLALALAAMAAPAGAATIHVKNTHDHGPGSLRKALDKADPNDTVEVPAGHYVVKSGELTLDVPIKLKGAGARETIIDANRDSRVLSIDAGDTVRIEGLTIREGDTDAMAGGGGIEAGVGSKLILDKVAILNNHVINNVAFQNGGGIESSDDVVIKRSLFASNHGYNGGAVDSSDEIRAVDSTFFNNFGGNPTFNGDGGVFDEPAKLTDSTVVGNQCFNGDGCGGALSAPILRGTVVAGNKAYEANGLPPGSPLNPGTSDNCTGTVISKGHNLSSGNDCQLDKPSDLEHKNPKLGPLRNNGGPTNTLAFGVSSPLFNAGAGNCTSRDQRGVKRPQGARCDIGAFELVP